MIAAAAAVVPKLADTAIISGTAVVVTGVEVVVAVAEREALITARHGSSFRNSVVSVGTS